MATQKELAEFWGVSEKTVYNLKREGIISAPIGRGGYDIQRATQQWLNHLRAKSQGQLNTGNEPEKETQEERKTRLSNDEKEMNILLKKIRAQQELKNWAPVQLLEYALQQFAAIVKTDIETWVPKMRRACPDIPIPTLKVVEKTGVKIKNELHNIDVPLANYAQGSEEFDQDWAKPIEIEDTNRGE